MNLGCTWATGAVLGLTLMAGPAAGVTIVDNFSYGDGTLHGAGDASGGWAGGWRTGSNSSSLQVSDGALLGQHAGNATFTSYRLFADPISLSSPNDPVWFSFQMNLDRAGGQQNARDHLMLLADANISTNALTDRAGFGRMNLNTTAGNTKWSAYVRQASGFIDFSTVDVPEDVWSHVVVKLTPTGTGAGSYTMWIDPNLSDIGAATPLLTGSYSLGGSYTGIVGVAFASAGRVAASGSVTENLIKFDSLRVSTDGAPTAVPEPAAASLAALGLLALGRRVRQK